jgi:hypothetical protein
MVLLIVAIPFLGFTLPRFQHGPCHFFEVFHPSFAAQWSPRGFRLSQALECRFVFGALSQEGGKVAIPFKQGRNLYQLIVLAREVGGDSQ